jgi:hypothetical protein
MFCAAPGAPGDLARVGEPEHGTGTILVVIRTFGP